MAQNSVDLVNLFSTVTQALTANQQALDSADGYNQDHGTNMVHTFQTITTALQKKQGASAATALQYASTQLAKSQTSGSAQQYAKNLAQAAGRFKGRPVDQNGAMELLKMLIGANQAPQQQAPAAPAQPIGADLLGALLGGGGAGSQQQPAPAATGADLLGALLGGAQSQPAETPAAPTGGDLLGTLLGGGSQTPQQNQDGIGLDDLLTAGLAFMQAKQSGGTNLQAIAQAFLAASGMGQAAHRQQSTQIVVNSFLQALTAVKPQ